MLHESIWFDRRSYDEAEELNQLYLNGLPLPVTHHDHHGGHHHHHGHHDHGKHGKTQHHDQHGKPHHHDNKHHDNKHHDHHGKNQHGRNQHHHDHGKHGKAPHSGGSHGVNEKRIQQLETENKELRQKTTELEEAMKKLELRVCQLESKQTTTTPAKAEVKEEKKEEKKEESDDDDDLFGSDSEEEDEEQERIKQERLKAYYEKKAKKPQVIAKSTIILDVKPWDDETDIAELEKCVRSVALDGLVWGSSKVVPIAYGIKKVQISCVVEDDKVGTDILDEKITEFEDLVQSVDVVAFNKL